jgi:hypothetical protein
MPERPQTPTSVKHCVAKLAAKYGGDTSKAFAICVAQMQKAGYLKKGSVQSTSKGKKADARHAGEKDAGKKMKSYERVLKAARKRRESRERDEKIPVMSELRDLAGVEMPHADWTVPDFALEPPASLSEIHQYAGLSPKRPDWEVSEGTSNALTEQQKRVAGMAPMIHTPWTLEEGKASVGDEVWYGQQKAKVTKVSGGRVTIKLADGTTIRTEPGLDPRWGAKTTADEKRRRKAYSKAMGH